MSQDFSREYYNVEPYLTINDPSNLPDAIQETIQDFINLRFGFYQDSLIFHSGYLYDLESIENNNPEVFSKNRKNLWIIPEYDLKYIFKNKQLGISQYWVNIKLDRHGQVLSCNFPDMVRRDLKIIPYTRIKYITDSLLNVNEEQIKNYPVKVDLSYDKEIDILQWQLCYLISSGKDSKDYSCFIVNAHDGSLIRKEGIIEYRPSICCPEPAYEPEFIEIKKE